MPSLSIIHRPNIPPQTVACVTQELPTFCFLACLESFLTENGRPINQHDLLGSVVGAFGTNSNDLGAFAPENFDKVAEVYGLDVFPLDARAVLSARLVFPCNETIFLLCHWEHKTWHWVRYLHRDETKVWLMNPGIPDRPDEIAVDKFIPWVLDGGSAHLLRLRPSGLRS